MNDNSVENIDESDQLELLMNTMSHRQLKGLKVDLAVEFIPTWTFEQFFDAALFNPKWSNRAWDLDRLSPEDMSTPYKGKPSSFFIMATDESKKDKMNPFGYDLTKDQWSFIFKFFPEYAQHPYDMMSWIYGQAKRKEETEAIDRAKMLTPE